MAHLSLVRRLVLRLTFGGCCSHTFRHYCSLAFRGCRSLTLRLSLLSFLATLLNMWLRVPVHVEPVATLILEEELLKECLKLCLCDFW